MGADGFVCMDYIDASLTLRCSLLHNISYEEKSKRYMLSHPQEFNFNMEPCWACVEKCLSHTRTGLEKQCKNKNKLPPLSRHMAELKRFLPHKEKKELSRPKP